MWSKWLSVAIYTAVFAAGWTACDWYRDSVELAEQRAADKAIAAFEKRESAVAATVESKLSALRANERVRTVKVPEIIKQPELVRVCLSEDAINSINAAVRELHNGTNDAGSKAANATK